MKLPISVEILEAAREKIALKEAALEKKEESIRGEDEQTAKLRNSKHSSTLDMIQSEKERIKHAHKGLELAHEVLCGCIKVSKADGEQFGETVWLTGKSDIDIFREVNQLISLSNSDQTKEMISKFNISPKEEQYVCGNESNDVVFEIRFPSFIERPPFFGSNRVAFLDVSVLVLEGFQTNYELHADSWDSRQHYACHGESAKCLY